MKTIIIFLLLSSSVYGQDTTHYQRGYDLVSQSKFKEAIKELTLAIEEDPKNAFAYMERGLAYRHLGNNFKCLSDYQKGEELNPNVIYELHR